MSNPRGKRSKTSDKYSVPSIRTRSHSVGHRGQTGATDPTVTDCEKVNNMSNSQYDEQFQQLLKQMTDLSATVTSEVSSVKSDVSSLRSDFESVKSEVSSFRSELAAVRKEVVDMKGTVNDIEKWVEDREAVDKQHEDKLNAMSDEMTNMQSNISDLQRNLIGSEKKFDQLKEYTLKLESQSRRDNLLFHGIPETNDEKNEKCLHELKCVLSECGVTDVDDIRFVRVHRLGAKDQHSKFPRPIIAKFHWFGDRMRVWGAKSDIRKIRGQKVFMTENYPPDIERRRKVLYPIFKAAKNAGREPSLVYDTLTLDGKKYTSDNIKDVPREFHPKYLATPTNNNITSFFTSDSPLSNFHPADVTDPDGTKYRSSEQMYQHRKALYHRDSHAASLILKSKTPYQAYKAGLGVKGQHQSDWYKGRELGREQMYKSVLTKFQQNPELCEFLIATGDTTIVEGNPTDSVWGVQLKYNDPDIFDPSMWNGKNWMGIILSKVRDELKSNT